MSEQAFITIHKKEKKKKTFKTLYETMKVHHYYKDYASEYLLLSKYKQHDNVAEEFPVKRFSLIISNYQ